MGRDIEARGWLMATILVGCLLGPAAHGKDVPSTALSPLDRGFNGLYNLDFDEAQEEFGAWQRLHPEDPMGPVSEAAGFLFSEFNRLGVLEAQFYDNDAAFEDRPKFSPDPALRGKFQDAIGRAEDLSRARLAKDPKDRDALFAMTLSSAGRETSLRRARWHPGI